MTLPNFLIIGAGKSGTTSVYHGIKQHPDIFMSRVKEPNFFALEGQQKITGYDKEDPDGFHFYPWAVTNLNDYGSLFNGVNGEKAIGESSTMYQYMPNAVDNIRKHIPDVKLIAIFRNPADRLYSRYLHLVRENRPPTANFTDCFDRKSLWWQKNDLIQEGFYYTHMSRYFNEFKPGNIKVILYEDLIQKPIGLLQDIFNFLDVDDSFVPDMSVRYNVSGRVKNKYVDLVIGQQSLVRRSLEWLSPALIRGARDNSLLQKIVTTLRKHNLERVPLLPAVRKRLIEEVYKDEILKFSMLIQRDLGHWIA